MSFKIPTGQYLERKKELSIIFDFHNFWEKFIDGKTDLFDDEFFDEK